MDFNDELYFENYPFNTIYPQNLDFIDYDNMERELRYLTDLFEKTKDQKSNTTNFKTEDELRKEADFIFAKVYDRIPYEHYNSSNVRYVNSSECSFAQTITKTDNYGFISTVDININQDYEWNLGSLDLTLAHEATHAALLNKNPEWVSELVALDVLTECIDKKERLNIEHKLYETKLLQLVDAFAYKMRDDGYKEPEIAYFLHDELGVPQKTVVDRTDTWQDKSGNFHKRFFKSRKKQIEIENEYFAKSYFVSQVMKKHDRGLPAQAYGSEFSIQLPYLMKHIDDWKQNAEKNFA